MDSTPPATAITALRRVERLVQGRATSDGAGVKLVRVLTQDLQRRLDPFLMLDEPFSMVEPLYKDLIKELLIQLKTKKGIIITDHYYNDVFSVTDRNLMLKDGQLFAVNGKNDLTAHGYLPSETE